MALSGAAAARPQHNGAGLKKRLGVFGGAFDPPHLAHVALAQAALAQLALDALHIVPTGQAWHKARRLSAAADRLAMTRLAFAGLERVVVDEREIQRAGPSFTVDTLGALQVEYPGANLYLILGADQVAALPNWHRWQEVLKIAIICIADRAYYTGAEDAFNPELQAAHPVVTLQLPLMPVSATDIRQQIASADPGSPDWHGLVPEPVASYIEHHRLYLSS